MEASCLRLVLASTDVADLGLAQKILIAKRVGDVSVCQSHSEVMALLAQRHEEGVATVIIAQVQMRQPFSWTELSATVYTVSQQPW